MLGGPKFHKIIFSIARNPLSQIPDPGGRVGGVPYLKSRTTSSLSARGALLQPENVDILTKVQRSLPIRVKTKIIIFVLRKYYCFATNKKIVSSLEKIKLFLNFAKCFQFLFFFPSQSIVIYQIVLKRYTKGVLRETKTLGFLP